MRSRSGIPVVMMVMFLALAGAPAAQAENICVTQAPHPQHPDCPSGAVSSSGLQAALTAAESTYPGKDTVYIGRGTYTAGGSGFDYSSADEIDIIGAGQSYTLLKMPAVNDGTTLSVGDSLLNDIESLRIDLPAAGNATGLYLRGEARFVSVFALTSATTNGRAVFLPGNGISALENVAIQVGEDVNGVDVFSTAPVVISDSLIRSGFYGIQAHNNGPLTIRRTTVESNDGIGILQGSLDNGTGTIIENSVVRLRGGTNQAVMALGNGVIAGDQLTLLGPGTGTGARAYGATNGETASMSLDNTILSGFGVDLRSECDSGGESQLTVTYSRFTSSNQDPGCGQVAAGAGNTSASPGLDSPGITNPTLRWNSALIDAGRPGASPFSFDRQKQTRVRDGDGVGGARRDIGATEYQRRPPTVNASAISNTVNVGQSLQFAIQVGDEPGDSPHTYAWTFDDGTSTTTPAPSHAFSTPGQHTATVVVTDPTGLTDSDSVTVMVNQLPTPPGAPGQPGGGGSIARDTVVPRVSGLAVTPSRFAVATGTTRVTATARPRRRVARGTTFRFRLTEAAAVKLTLQRVLPGRRTRSGRCGRPTRALRRARRCTRFVKKGTLTRKGVASLNRVKFTGRLGRRALALGRYRVLIVATDLAGNRSRSASKRFTIIHP